MTPQLQAALAEYIARWHGSRPPGGGQWPREQMTFRHVAALYGVTEQDLRAAYRMAQRAGAEQRRRRYKEMYG